MLIKAITLHQPWASMMALGHKTIETRSWSTKYRGPLAIHAARTTASMTGEVAVMIDRLVLDRPHGVSFAHRYGEVLAIVKLISVIPADKVGFSSALPPHEEGLGDYSRGQWAWITRMMYVLPDPWPARGHQGLWNWQVPDHMIKEMEQALKSTPRPI